MLDLTVLILTYNERENIGRTLEALRWADRVLIVDSYSTDDTLQIAGGFPNVQVVQRPFESFASQCNFGLEQIGTEWVLSIDADYVLTSELIGEIRGLTDDAATAGLSSEGQREVSAFGNMMLNLLKEQPASGDQLLLRGQR